MRSAAAIDTRPGIRDDVAARVEAVDEAADSAAASMADSAARGRSAWDDALLAAACAAVDPVGLGGVRVRSMAGPVRDAWLAAWRAMVPVDAPVRNVPLHIDDGRLIGGIDLAASLRAGHAVEQPGLLAQLDGGHAVLSMAERIDPSTAARIASVVENGRTGRGADTRFGVIAFDEGEADEGLAATLAERLALSIDLRECSMRAVAEAGPSIPRAAVEAARSRLARVDVPDDVVSALCAAAVAFGIGSLRVPTFALRVARTLAALGGRDAVDGDDAAVAARLVLSSRARRLPTASPTSEVAEPAVAEPADERGDDAPDASDRLDDPEHVSPDSVERDDRVEEHDGPSEPARSIEEMVVDAGIAAIPRGLLERLVRDAAVQRSGASKSVGAGAARRGRRGAPSGVRRGRPRPPERLGLIETLRAAAPWQRVRRAEASNGRSNDRSNGARVLVRADDLHVVRFRQRMSTTTVFVVDASGSSALHRLGEAKGAVELLLADCYVRRDSVAVLAFRGIDTQLLLPPTRSLVRARRSLAALPGGGGTPLASALDATRELVVQLRRRGDTVLVVLLTDGRGNVARDGSGGRERAEADAVVSARALRALDVDALLIDTSPQPGPQAARLADAIGASYRPLPYAGASEMSAVVNRAARARSSR